MGNDDPLPSTLNALNGSQRFMIESIQRRNQGIIHVYEVFLAIAQIPAYVPGGASSFWKLIGLLLPVIGFLIALWLIWVLLRWVAKKLASAIRKK
jgi:hypothetical protein